MIFYSKFFICFCLLLLTHQAQGSEKKEYQVQDSAGKTIMAFCMTKNKLSGKYEVWYSNGQLAVEGTLKNGKREGLWQAWYSNGQQFFKRTFLNGDEDGTSFYWYENGNIGVQGGYKKGWKSGEWALYSESGQLKAKGVCERNSFHGDWTFIENGIATKYDFIYGELTQGLADQEKNNRLLCLSAASFTMTIRGHKRFIWRLNQVSDYQLECDVDIQGQYYGLYEHSRSWMQYELNQKGIILCTRTHASLIGGMKQGYQEFSHYSISREANLRTNIHDQLKTRIVLIQGYNLSGKFKGKVSQRDLYTGKLISRKVNEMKQDAGILLADEFTPAEHSYADSANSLLTVDSICIRKLHERKLQIMQDCVFKDQPGPWIDVKVYRQTRDHYRTILYTDAFVVDEQFIQDPAYKFAVLYYDNSKYVGNTYYNRSSMTEIVGLDQIVPFNILLHGEMKVRSMDRILCYTYDYGLLIDYKTEAIK